MSDGEGRERHSPATAEARTLAGDRPALYRALLARVDAYADRQIATELGSLLPRAQRRWVRSDLQERTRELLRLRLAAMAEH